MSFMQSFSKCYWPLFTWKLELSHKTITKKSNWLRKKWIEINYLNHSKCILYTYTHTHTHTHVYVRTNIYRQDRRYPPVHAYAYTCTHARTHTLTHRVTHVEHLLLNALAVNVNQQENLNSQQVWKLSSIITESSQMSCKCRGCRITPVPIPVRNWHIATSLSP